MKHFIDIQAIKEEDVLLTNGTIIGRRNTSAFEIGDDIQITEKIDGSNASVRYNTETGKLDAFSRKQELTFSNTLDGFWNYVSTLDKNTVEQFAKHSNYVVFGEWLRKNKIIYNKDAYHIWYIYDIYNAEKEVYLKQDDVKQFCRETGLPYIHVLYEGPFISWEHCRTFMNSPIYGDRQEGIVIKNQSKLDDPECKDCQYLKIVNDSFKERMKVREVDPIKEGERAAARALMESIVTKARVEKMILKLRDEQMLPDIIGPEQMGLVAKVLPRRIYDDCVKEEFDTVKAAGEYAGKICSSITMEIARTLLTKN